MKNIFTLSVFLLALLLSCSKGNDNNLKIDSEVIGTWLLTEVYLDPGDGSGDFVPVDSSKIVTFQTNGIVSSNGDLCFVSSQSGSSSTGTFSDTEMTITIENCELSTPILFYEVTSENVLVLSYQCIEACQEKYTRVDN